MLLSTSRRFIFVHVPKTAGLSIKSALQPYATKPERTLLRRLLSHLPVPEAPEKAWLRDHDKAVWARRKLPAEVFQSYHKFAVVRDPYDYAASYYLFLQRNRTSRRHAEAANWSFLDFLNYMQRKNRFGSINQVSWIADGKDDFIVDEILRFERLASDFARVASRLGIEEAATLPHVNRGETRNYRDMYGPRERRLAEAVFARDLALLGYAF